MVIDDTWSVEGIYAFIYCTKWRSGRVSRMPDWLTHSLTTLKYSSTQLLIKYKSGALVTQFKDTNKYIVNILICIFEKSRYFNQLEPFRKKDYKPYFRKSLWQILMWSISCGLNLFIQSLVSNSFFDMLHSKSVICLNALCK